MAKKMRLVVFIESNSLNPLQDLNFACHFCIFSTSKIFIANTLDLNANKSTSNLYGSIELVDCYKSACEFFGKDKKNKNN